VTPLALSIAFVHGIEQGAVDKSTGPDHAPRPHHDLAENGTEGEAEELGAECKKDLIEVADGLTVEYLLRGENIGGVGSLRSNIRHHGNYDMFLDGEGTRIDVATKNAILGEACKGFSEREGNDKNDQVRQEYGRV